jgi:hypothetical protein
MGKEKIIVLGPLDGWGGWKDINPDDYKYIIFLGNILSYDATKYSSAEAIKNILGIMKLKSDNHLKVKLVIGLEDAMFFFDDEAAILSYYKQDMFTTQCVNMISHTSYRRQYFDYCFQYRNWIVTYGGLTSNWLAENMTKFVTLGLGLYSTNIGRFFNTNWQHRILEDSLISASACAPAIQIGGVLDYPPQGPLWAEEIDIRNNRIEGLNQIVSNSNHRKKLFTIGEYKKNNSITYTNCIDHNKNFADQINNFVILEN